MASEAWRDRATGSVAQAIDGFFKMRVSPGPSFPKLNSHPADMCGANGRSFSTKPRDVAADGAGEREASRRSLTASRQR